MTFRLHFLWLTLVAVLFFFVLISVATAQESAPSVSISEAEIVEGLARPAVVSVMQHVDVLAEISDFEVDPDTLAFELIKDALPYTANDTYYMVTQGVLVSQDGYIFTTAHGVSDAAITVALATKVVEDKLAALTGGTDEEMAYSDEEIDAAILALVDEVLAHASFKITKDVRVVRTSVPTDVSADNSIIEGVFNRARHADLIYSNNDFHKEGFDLALLKVDGEGLPALGIAGMTPESNSRVYTLQSSIAEEATETGFAKGFMTATMLVDNEGVVSILDATTNETSGGPLLNGYGEVVAILSTLPGSRSAGAEELIRVINRQQITTGFGTYAQTFMRGVGESRDLKCAQAHDTFETARSVAGAFGGTFDTSLFVDRCEAVLLQIEEEKSLLDGLMEGMQVENLLNKILIGVSVLFGIVLLIIVLWFINRVRSNRKNGKKMQSMEGTRLEDRAQMPVMDSVGQRRVEVAVKSADKPQMLDRMRTTLESDDVANGGASTRSEKPVTVEVMEVHESSADSQKMRPNNSAPTVGDVPEGDEERLAALWPKKYSDAPIQNAPTEEAGEAESASIADDPNVHEEERPEESTDPGLIAYITETKKLGFSDDTIVAELKKAGWEMNDIKKAFASLEQ